MARKDEGITDQELSPQEQDAEPGASALPPRAPVEPVSPASWPSIRLRVYDALSQGILIVSNGGQVVYYNTAYARLRNLTPGEMLGRPLEALDHRRPARTLLHSGALPSAEPVVAERRRNRETVLPLWEEGHLVGLITVVTPGAEGSTTAGGNPRQRPLDPAGGNPTWPAQYTFADIIGNSPDLTQARELARRAAQGASSVLLVGESGTGKELFAHAIHAASPRRACPFVPVDCSAIPRELLEAELFGYAPGAFTGAAKEGKPGRFELAHGGTILLDEIGEMPLEMQAKLLRVLQERRITRVGGVTPLPVDFAVIASTHRDLETLVAQGQFRRDLLYRLDVLRIDIPPLRERPEDIPLLVDYYWAWKSRDLGRTAKLSADTLRVLERYTWPGNVRELLNLVERLLVSVSKQVIEPEDLPPALTQALADRAVPFPPFHLPTVVAEAERRTLERALQQAQGNRNKAAQLVGLSRASFYRKLKEHGLL